MTAYTTIIDDWIDPKSPVVTPLMFALRDNLTAVTEGAAGAPRIATAAMVAPTAGTNIIARLGAGMQSTADTSLTEAGSCVVLVPGTVTVEAKVWGSGGGYLEFWKNDASVASWIIGSSQTVRSADITVSLGDRITVFYKTNNGSAPASIKDIYVKSGTLNFAVA